jgi:hypothetical protein
MQLNEEKINQIVREVAKANLAPYASGQVVNAPTTDSVGQDALRITIVIAPDAAPKIKGDAVVDTLVQIQNRLREAGEERFPIVEYATEEELEVSGDSQS